MLMRRSINLDDLNTTIPPIDEDQKLALLHAPFMGTTLFGELAKLQEANTKRASALTVSRCWQRPCLLFFTSLYVGRGNNYNSDRKGGLFSEEKWPAKSPGQAQLPQYLSLGRPKMARLV